MSRPVLGCHGSRSRMRRYRCVLVPGVGDATQIRFEAALLKAMREAAARGLSSIEARSYRVEAGRLTLLDAGGNESLIFEADKR